MITKRFRFNELSKRLEAEWSVSVAVDHLNRPADAYPYEPGTPNAPLTSRFGDLNREINRIAVVGESGLKIYPCETRSKTKRPVIITESRADAERHFTAALALARNSHRSRMDQIAALQREQTAIIKQIRKNNTVVNSAKLKEAKTKLADERAALADGRFWECRKELLKNYFNPPFGKNCLVDVSERWRAALFIKVESESYRYGYNNNWGHKLVDTGDAYLCGIDDNGDEWGIRCTGGYNSTVEDAMSDIFGISVKSLTNCQRQGDLLVCPEEIPGEREVCSKCGFPWKPAEHIERALDIAHREGIDFDSPEMEGIVDRKYTTCYYCDRGEPKHLPAVELHSQEKWEIRESHEAWSPSARRNGHYFRADHDITITHPTHEMLVLPAGSYRLYLAPEQDAD